MSTKSIPDLSKVQFSVQGTTVSVYKINESESTDVLAPGVYSVQFSLIRGFFLNVVSKKLSTPKKIYGNVSTRTAKILGTYNSRKASLGVLCTGTKGSGKSLLTSHLCNEAIKQGLPVVLVNESHHGENFNEFIDNLGECVLVFDEFAKVYTDGNGDSIQDELLTLMDGVKKLKRLIVLIENDAKDIDSFIINRPGRMYYHFKYDKMEESFITEYCSDNKVPDQFCSEIIEHARSTNLFTFDILQSVVEEYLRFPDIFEVVIEDLNIKSVITEQKIEILKIVDFETKKEIKVPLAYKYLNKPSRYSRPGIQFFDPSLISKDDETGEVWSELNIRHLKYSKGDLTIYQCQNGYVFTTKDFKIESTDWSCY